MDLQKMLAQAQKMQQQLEVAKKEVEQKTVTAEAGGGMVKVTMSGENLVKELKIAKEIVDPEEIEMLEDLIIAAINKASKEAGEMIQAEMQKAAGPLAGMPGMGF
jgi:DNA-binding YbaB/EbfC family protein